MPGASPGANPQAWLSRANVWAGGRPHVNHENLGLVGGGLGRMRRHGSLRHLQEERMGLTKNSARVVVAGREKKKREKRGLRKAGLQM